MPYWLLFAFHKIFAWSKRSTPAGAMWGVLMATVFPLFFNVVTVLALIEITTGINLLAPLIPPSRGKIVFFIFVPMAVAIYAIIKLFKVEERADAPANIRVYKERRYKSFYLAIYFVASFAAFIWSVWNMT